MGQLISHFDQIARLPGARVFDVRAFGAIGDGEADDTAAVQDAMDAAVSAGGGIVFVPVGDYKMTGKLEVNGDDLTLAGTGRMSRLFWTVGTIGIECVSHDRLCIERLRLVGTRIADTGGGDYHAIMVGEANNVRVQQCWIEDWIGNGMFLIGFNGLGQTSQYTQGVWDSWILDNRIRRTTSGVFLINDCRRVLVRGNIVERVNGVGIFLDDSHRTDGSETPNPCTNILVEGNTITEVSGTGIALAGTHFSTVRGNHVTRGGQAIDPHPNVAGIVLQTVQNNIECRRNLICENFIAYNTNGGIGLIGASDNLILGNHIYNNSYLRASGGTANVNLVQSVVGETTYGSSRNIIRNNFIEDDTSDSTTGNQVAIQHTSCDGNDVSYNVLRGGASVTKLSDNGSNTTATGNIEDTLA